jgi:hypothetical protein
LERREYKVISIGLQTETFVAFIICCVLYISWPNTTLYLGTLSKYQHYTSILWSYATHVIKYLSLYMLVHNFTMFHSWHMIPYTSILWSSATHVIKYLSLYMLVHNFTMFLFVAHDTQGFGSCSPFLFFFQLSMLFHLLTSFLHGGVSIFW